MDRIDNAQRSPWSSRMQELGLQLPVVAVPVAAYVPAVRSGTTVLTSGQLPFIEGVLPQTGSVGADLDTDQARELARLCALNALAAVTTVARLDDIVRILKVTGFVASATGFTAQAQVVDGASEFLGLLFGEVGRHARSAVGVAALPLGAPVEVELAVEIQSGRSRPR